MGNTQMITLKVEEAKIKDKYFLPSFFIGFLFLFPCEVL